MLGYEEFAGLCKLAIPKLGKHWLNPEQESAVSEGPEGALYIIAGPGTGKTTVLALRVLKHIFVDAFEPNTILATTFTRKAAHELKSRILSWGYLIREQLLVLRPELNDRLNSLDVNDVHIGTLDAISEQWISESRRPGEVTPVAIDPFIKTALIRSRGLFPTGGHHSEELSGLISQIKGQKQGVNVNEVSKFLSGLADRLTHDDVDVEAFRRIDKGIEAAIEAIDHYKEYTFSQNLADFSALERIFFERVKQGVIPQAKALSALVVDEYQDTNFLQESIYFEIIKQSGAAITVVGDDDQSIFRFRGATVELFSALQQRFTKYIGETVKQRRVDLIRNYRSTEPIVRLINDFTQKDSGFQGARVKNKQPIVCNTGGNAELPVLGMFRENKEALAKDLAEFIHDVFRGKGRRIALRDKTILLRAGEQGDVGDGVLLAHSIQEISKFRPDNPQRKFPSFLREELESRGIAVFNPRGVSLSEVRSVKILLGLALLCIDPAREVEKSIETLSRAARNVFAEWRAIASAFVGSDPSPGGLRKFVDDWANRRRAGRAAWPSEWPLLELVFTLITWLPDLYDTPEGQVYTEAVARSVSQITQIDNYGGQLLHNRGRRDAISIARCIRNVFEPIALGLIDLNDEIMPHVPRQLFPMMTIHQAKGLEFPLTVVDVGSHWHSNRPANRHFRAPVKPGEAHLIEEILAPFSPVGPARLERSGVRRAWDDIKREYFVAFSRAQDVLLLVGCDAQIRSVNPVWAISVGDTEDGSRCLRFVPADKWSEDLEVATVALI